MQTEFIEADLDLENWITGTSYAQAKVTIYRNPALLAEYEPLMERIEELEQAIERDGDSEESLTAEAHPHADSHGEASLTDDTQTNDELAELYQQAEQLHAKFMADAEVWTLRALEPNEITELQATNTRPLPPKPLAMDATDEQRGEHQADRDAYQKALEAWGLDLNLRSIAKAVIGVTVAGRDVPKPDITQLSVLPNRPGGYRHVVTLADAIVTVSGQEVGLLAPHRRRA